MCFSYTFVVRFQYSMMIMMICWFVSDNEEEKNKKNLFVICQNNSNNNDEVHWQLLGRLKSKNLSMLANYDISWITFKKRSILLSVG